MEGKEFIQNFKQRTGNSDKESKILLEYLANSIGNLLYEGNTIILPGLGRFIPEISEERIDTDSQGQNILYPPEVKIKFTSAESLKARLNENRNG